MRIVRVRKMAGVTAKYKPGAGATLVRRTRRSRPWPIEATNSVPKNIYATSIGHPLQIANGCGDDFKLIRYRYDQPPNLMPIVSTSRLEL